MFCPQCRKEYEEGIYLCGDCRISLVPDLQPDPLNEPQECAEFEEILFTSNAGDMAVIKSLLESEGMIYYFKGEFASHAHPFPQPAVLMVRRNQAEEAKEILESLNISFTIPRPCGIK